MPREYDADSKFQLRNLGSLMHPACCLACGVGNRQEGYVDLATFFDYEGQMYLCRYCLEEAAEVMGCLTEREAEAIQARSLELASENKQLTEKLNAAESRLASIDLLIAPLVGDLISNPASEDSSEGQGPVGAGPLSSLAGAAAGEPVAKEPVKVTRSAKSSQSSAGNASDLNL